MEGFRCTSETIVRCTSEYHAAWASSRNLRSSLSSLDTPCRLRRRLSWDESLDIDADRARLLLFLFERSWITSTIKDKASNMGTLPGVKPPLLPPFPWRCRDCPKPFQELFLCQEDPFPSVHPAKAQEDCKTRKRLSNGNMVSYRARELFQATLLSLVWRHFLLNGVPSSKHIEQKRHRE